MVHGVDWPNDLITLGLAADSFNFTQLLFIDLYAIIYIF